jgi:hypothetical protein
MRRPRTGFPLDVHPEQSEILREVYPERQSEILRSAQNDSERAQNDKQRAGMTNVSKMIAFQMTSRAFHKP